MYPRSLKNYSGKLLALFVVCLTGCAGKAVPPGIVSPLVNVQQASGSYAGSLERTFLACGLVNVQTNTNRFFVQLSYSDTANFLHQDVYGILTRCYLHPETMKKLQVADSLLQVENPDYHFLLFDGARPLSIQKLMYQLYRKMPVAQGLYLSHPDHYSLHNFGAAVDLTVCNKEGKPIDMGTEFDHFGNESHITDEGGLVRSGKITGEAYNNRRMLRRIMQKAGFTPILFEWWHFNSCSRGYATAHYTLIP